MKTIELRPVLAVAILMLGAGFSDARASELDTGLPRDVAIEIDVTGSIPVRCGSAQPQNFPVEPGDLNRAGSMEFVFDLDCNAPFVVGVTSANGAFVGGQDDGSGFAFRKTYSVGLSVDTDAGELTTPTCLSSALALAAPVGDCAFRGVVPGEGLSSGEATAIRRNGRLTVDWTAGGDGRRLASGRFQDTLTVTFGART